MSHLALVTVVLALQGGGAGAGPTLVAAVVTVVATPGVCLTAGNTVTRSWSGLISPAVGAESPAQAALKAPHISKLTQQW